MDHNHGGLVQIIFLSKWVICRFQPLIFQGVRSVHKKKLRQFHEKSIMKFLVHSMKQKSPDFMEFQPVSDLHHSVGPQRRRKVDTSQS